MKDFLFCNGMGAEPVSSPLNYDPGLCSTSIILDGATRLTWCPPVLGHYRSLMSLSYRLGILNRKVSPNRARSVTHRREDNNRVGFLTEEKEKLRTVIEAK
jgi:hypothetical protein